MIFIFVVWYSRLKWIVKTFIDSSNNEILSSRSRKIQNLSTRHTSSLTRMCLRATTIKVVGREKRIRARISSQLEDIYYRAGSDNKRFNVALVPFFRWATRTCSSIGRFRAVSLWIMFSSFASIRRDFDESSVANKILKNGISLSFFMIHIHV